MICGDGAGCSGHDIVIQSIVKHSTFKHIQTIISKPRHGIRHCKADPAHQKDKFVEIATKEEEA